MSRLIAAAGAAALLVALTACGSPAPSPAPTTAPTPSSTALATCPEPSEIPTPPADGSSVKWSTVTCSWEKVTGASDAVPTSYAELFTQVAAVDPTLAMSLSVELIDRTCQVLPTLGVSRTISSIMDGINQGAPQPYPAVDVVRYANLIVSYCQQKG